MTTVMEYLDEYPVMFMFLLMGLGMLLGRLKIGGIGLEAAAVLFLAIGVSALGAHLGIRVTIDEELGTVGLAIFAFAIGNSAGKSFFRSLKQASGPIAMMISVFIVAAGVAYVLGRYVFHMDGALIAGTFSGGITNTPALAAAGEAVELAAHGVRIVIYANQLTRAAFPSMENAARSILVHHRAHEIDKELLPIKDIIRLIEVV